MTIISNHDPLWSRSLLLVGIMAIVAGQLACSHASTPEAIPLTHLDFRYDSRDHMAPSRRIVRIEASVDEVRGMLLEELREADASEIEESTEPNRSFETRARSDEIFERRRKIAELEWAAYRTRDRAAYYAIDRSALEESELIEAFDSEMESLSIMARVWARKARFVTSSVSYAGDQRRETRSENRKPLASRIRFDLWGREGSAETFVYITAAPVVMGATASAGETLPLDWLEFVDGKDEARLVESYIRILGRW